MFELRDTIRRLPLWQKLLAALVIVVLAAVISAVLTGSAALGAVLAAIALVAINPPNQGRSANRER